MKRRDLLAGVSMTTATLAGCLSGDDNEADDNERDEVEYEQCARTYVSVPVSLPAPAEEEAIAAIEDGEHETDGDPVLPQAVDIEEAYLIYRHDDNKRYYTVEIEEERDVNRLRVEETVPETNPVAVGNDTGEELTVDVRLEYAAIMDREIDVENEGDVLSEETVKVGVGQDVELDGDVEYRYGMYRAEVNVNELALEEEITWLMWEEWDSHGKIHISSTEEVNYVPSDVYHPDGEVGDCEWNDDGTLVAGPGAD